MKKMKRFAALTLAVLLSLTLAVPALAADKPLYTDTPDTAALELLKLVNVFDGYPDGAFHGEKILTRAQLTKVACQLLGVTVDEKAVPTFDDAKDNWAAAYIAAAYDAGIINGKSAAVFDPDAPVTRYQAAMIFARMLGFDDSKVASLPWAERVETAVKTAKLTGFLKLDGGSLTRAEAANAAYTTLLTKVLSPTELSSALTANTLAGKLGVSAESGKTANGAATVRFTRRGQTTAAYPVAAGASLPAATASPVSEAVSADPDATVYAYLVNTVGSATWDDGRVYQTLEFWDGSRMGQLYTRATVPTQRPLLMTFEMDKNGELSTMRFNYPGDGTLFSGAITLLEDDYFGLSDGSCYAYTEDTVYLYIDSTADTPEKVGCEADTLRLADKDGGGLYVDNVFFTLDRDGKLACVIYDVNNAVPAVTP